MASFAIIERDGRRILAPAGDWTVWTIAPVEPALRAAAKTVADLAAIEVAGLGQIDTAGAHLLASLAPADPPIVGDHPKAARVFAAVRAARATPLPATEKPVGLRAALETVGRIVAGVVGEFGATFAFFGRMLEVGFRLLRRPSRIRWVSVASVMESAGVNALPIISLLSFFIGVVVAYLGARILGDFGASVFTVELVAFSVMREFAVVITAVLLAGRTCSAFAAEIGAMKMRQEIDAMRVLGLDPLDAIAAPRILAMLVMTPLLTFAAMIAGLFGGLIVCWAQLQVSPVMFVTRISEAVPQQHFWVGMAKAPVFGVVLALVGIRHGLETEGDVISLGRRTTAAVVQAIFLVILIDALMALWFLEMNL